MPSVNKYRMFVAQFLGNTEFPVEQSQSPFLFVMCYKESQTIITYHIIQYKLVQESVLMLTKVLLFKTFLQPFHESL